MERKDVLALKLTVRGNLVVAHVLEVEDLDRGDVMSVQHHLHSEPELDTHLSRDDSLSAIVPSLLVDLGRLFVEGQVVTNTVFLFGDLDRTEDGTR